MREESGAVDEACRLCTGGVLTHRVVGTRADVVADYPAAPPIDSPVYAQTSLITADVALGLGYFQGDEDGHGQAVASGRVNIPLWAGWNEEFEVAGLTLFDGDFSAVGAFSHTYYKNCPTCTVHCR